MRIRLLQNSYLTFAFLLATNGFVSADERPNQPASKCHWAWTAPIQPALPMVQSTEWMRNPIDHFILAKSEATGLKPAACADAATLLRRVHFDLTGLPPTPEEVEQFLKEHAAKPQAAYEAVIDKLLASPHYGERWGRHWLDVVRYADSAGYEIDNFYPHACIYRDYVIRSFNEDKPFDRFVQEQIAGDEMWPDSTEAKIATGFATVGPFAFEGGIERPRVIEYQRLTDLADTTGSAFLGLTVGCARCHDHKYDPITQKDYFGLQAIFAASEPNSLRIGEPNRVSDRVMAGEAKVLTHRDKVGQVHVLKRGELESPLDAVGPALLRSFPGGRDLDINRKDEAKSRRTALAKWLTSAENPLTARVIVNRIWQWHFGTGFVRTPNDFGRQGAAPTHPELLDWLALDFMNNGWRIKRLHKLIMMSGIYQSTRFPRRRLEAEIVWDHLHAASGTLNRQQFGPAVVPPIDRKYLETLINKNWKVTDDPKLLTRRGVYLVVRRSLTLPFFAVFNLGAPIESCSRRDVTIVSSQALAMLNGAVPVEQARHFAGRLLREGGGDLDKMIARGWLLAFSRPIGDEERNAAKAFITLREKDLVDVDEDRRPTPLGDTGKAKVDPARAAALVEWCLALFNANEFLYVD